MCVCLTSSPISSVYSNSKKKRLINSIISMLLYTWNVFLLFLIISLVHGNVMRAYILLLSYTRAASRLRKAKKKSKRRKEELSAFFFFALTIWCIYVCAYCTVIPLLPILLSHNTFVLSFVVRNLLNRQKKGR